MRWLGEVARVASAIARVHAAGTEPVGVVAVDRPTLEEREAHEHHDGHQQRGAAPRRAVLMPGRRAR